LPVVRGIAARDQEGEIKNQRLKCKNTKQNLKIVDCWSVFST
jgi:hypothetical protein